MHDGRFGENMSFEDIVSTMFGMHRQTHEQPENVTLQATLFGGGINISLL